MKILNGWIPIEAQKPEVGKNVLVWAYGKRDIGYCTLDTWLVGEHWLSAFGDGHIPTITHWQYEPWPPYVVGDCTFESEIGPVRYSFELGRFVTREAGWISGEALDSVKASNPDDEGQLQAFMAHCMGLWEWHE